MMSKNGNIILSLYTGNLHGTDLKNTISVLAEVLNIISQAWNNTVVRVTLFNNIIIITHHSMIGIACSMKLFGTILQVIRWRVSYLYVANCTFRQLWRRDKLGGWSIVVCVCVYVWMGGCVCGCAGVCEN